MPSLLTPRSHRRFQVAALVLHREAVFWGHVRQLSGHGAEVQLLDDDCQEEVDLVPRDDLADASPLPHAEGHHPLPLQLVDRGAVSAQETVRVKGGRVFPQLAEKDRG